MTAPVAVHIPGSTFERIQKIAYNSDESPEIMLSAIITMVYERFENLSDEELWEKVHQPLAYKVDTRLRQLTEMGKARDLSAEEQVELEGLIKEYDSYVLRRSKAMLLLKERGHDVMEQLTLDED